MCKLTRRMRRMKSNEEIYRFRVWTSKKNIICSTKKQFTENFPFFFVDGMIKKMKKTIVICFI